MQYPHRTVDVWLSPHEPVPTPRALADRMAAIGLPGHETWVLIPTLYDDWYQQDVQRSLGDALAVDNAHDASLVKDAIESAAPGVRVGAWSVPRGTGDAYAEGAQHGLLAAQFDRYVINFEAGWSDFWIGPTNAHMAQQWVDGFWHALRSSGRDGAVEVGFTVVTNDAMLGAVSDEVFRIFVDASHYDSLEVYRPGDPGLDPHRGRARWEARLQQIGRWPRRVVSLLELGVDLDDYRAWSERDGAVQCWTLHAAELQPWPGADGTLIPTTPTDSPSIGNEFSSLEADLISRLGYIRGDVAAQLRAETNRRGAPRKRKLRELITELERAAA